MALRSTILAAVETAFSALGDLVVDVTLNQSDAVNYDFASGQTITTAAESMTIQGILFTEERALNDRHRATNTLILRTADAGNLDAYDSFTVGGRTYALTSYSDNGFTVEIQLSEG